MNSSPKPTPEYRRTRRTDPATPRAKNLHPTHSRPHAPYVVPTRPATEKEHVPAGVVQAFTRGAERHLGVRATVCTAGEMLLGRRDAVPGGTGSVIRGWGFLLGSAQHVGDDRAWLGWLPCSVRVAHGDRPLDVDVDASSR